MLKRSRILAFILVFLLVATSITFAAPSENGNMAFDKKVLARIDAEKALQHIKYLSQTIGPRVAGTKEERQAAQYIKSQLDKLGYNTQTQEFDIRNIVPQVIIDSMNNQTVKANAAIGSGYTDGAGITSELVNCGLGATMQDFPADVAGKIAFVQRGSVSFAIKAENAVNAGAIGVLMYNNISGSLNPTLGTYESPIPYVSISLENGKAIVAEMTNAPVVVTIKAELFTKSQNIIATRQPKKVKDAGIVYVTAHYDSVPYAPGANDNASGTAMLLEFAKILKAYPIDMEVRFIACGAEEIGLDGSYYYVSQLSEDEINRSVANFNMDMIATSAEACNILYMDTVSGEENFMTDIAIAAGARIGNNILAVGKGQSSDHRYFGEAGIPAGCFIWGDEEGNLEEWYHTPNDTIARNISLERLQSAAEVVGSALYDVIRKQTPNLEKRNTGNTNIEKNFMYGFEE